MTKMELEESEKNLTNSDEECKMNFTQPADYIPMLNQPDDYNVQIKNDSAPIHAMPLNETTDFNTMINQVNNEVVHENIISIHTMPLNEITDFNEMLNKVNNEVVHENIVPVRPLPLNEICQQPHPHRNKSIFYIKNNINKIVNVYQQFYNNFSKATGFGDFIRGSYFIIQFCERYGLKYEISMNHPIKKYLKMHSCDLYKECEPNLLINAFDKPNFHPDNPEKSANEEIIDNFFDYLKDPNQRIKNKTASVYVISFPFKKITEQHRQIMRNYLAPTELFKNFIINLLHSSQLIFKKYIVIHVRSGDSVLIYNQDINLEYLKNIIIEIYKIYNPRYNYLLLSDSVKLKEKIIKVFPTIRSHFKEISHLGEGVKLSEETIKNTMVDFFLMAYSEKIYSYSCYDHGTGFSKWCAETFNIPYKCTTVK
jgi:hypothetical protein